MRLGWLVPFQTQHRAIALPLSRSAVPWSGSMQAFQTIWSSMGNLPTGRAKPYLQRIDSVASAACAASTFDFGLFPPSKSETVPTGGDTSLARGGLGWSNERN